MRASQRLVLRMIRTKFRLLSAISKRAAAKQAFALFCTPQRRNLKALPRNFNEAEVLQFKYKNDLIQGYRWAGGAGRKALILHGYESSVVNFDRYIRPLLRKGYEVMAFDAPAHGRSSGRQINVLLYREFIKHIVAIYGPVQSFMAHSLGGLAICLALEDIPHDADTRIALIAPATETTTAVKSFVHFLRLEAAVVAEMEKLIHKIGGQPSAWYSVSRALPHLKAQIFWAHDKNDNMTPLADVEPVMKQAYPNIVFRITEGLGHSRIYRDNNTTKAIIEFL